MNNDVPEMLRLELAPVRVNGPVMVSPALRTLSEAAPVRAAVIVPALKFPEVSLATADVKAAVETIFVELNAVLPAFQTI